jgi:para-nitrobenzyl esterase
MSGPIALTCYGNVEGSWENGLAVWRGIPFAKPPLGPLRFRPPEPPDPWNETRPTTRFGPMAPQRSWAGVSLSEDCLNLNIWSPAADDRRRPVLVWIFGGGWFGGDSSDPLFDGAAFASHGDAVVVTINYRLGLIGFLHLGEIGGLAHAASGNRGILDQIAALRWVRDNIAAFGGDPERVTVFGESAGAFSIGAMLAMPLARGLFRRAILQSGVDGLFFSSATATGIAEYALAALGVGRDELTKLDAIPVEQCLEVGAAIPQSLSPYRGLSFVPVVDGTTLPQSPLEAIANGSARDVDILIGTNRDECRSFLSDPNWRTYDDEALRRIGHDRVHETWPAVAPFYLNDGTTGEALRDATLALLTASIFTYPALRLAEDRARHGAPVWLYRFRWASPVEGGLFGAAHDVEIPFVFDNLDAPVAVELTGDSPDRQPLADRMHRAWIAFAHGGDPNTSSLPPWPRYDLERRATMIFNRDDRVEHDPAAAERQVWERAAPRLYR